MAYLIIFLLTIFSYTTTNALDLPLFNAKYELTINGDHIADETRILNKTSDNVYTYTTDAKSSLLLSLFKKYTINTKSIFTINDLGLNSQYYSIIKNNGGTIKEDTQLEINSKDKIVTNIKNNQTLKSESGNIIDNLNILLALQYDILNNPIQEIYSYQVADSKKIKPQKFHNKGEHTITIYDKDIEAIKVVMTKADNSKTTAAYFAINNKYIPVLIQQKNHNKDKEYTYTISDINLKRPLHK